jgi:hypothetical protein
MLVRRQWSLALAAAVLALSLLVGVALAAPAPRPPENTKLPEITGTPRVGQTLTAQEGNWSGTAPITYAFQWLRCDAQGANCATIPGATAKTYVVTAADLGRRLRVRVTARNTAGSANATSNPTVAVTAAAPPPPPGGSVPIESVILPERLAISQVAFSPNRITSLSQRTSVRVRVTTTRGVPVRGALVFLRSTPVVTTTPPEQATGNDGTTTFNIVPEADLRLFFRPGYNLQFFVRARKPGESALAGVSSRRLVQVALAP